MEKKREIRYTTGELMGAEKMSIALKVYQGLTDETDEKVKAKLIADAFEELEQRYPEVKDLATGVQLMQNSLLLQKEIKEVDSNLQLKIQEMDSNLHREMKEMDSNLRKEIQEVDSNLRKDIQEMNSNLRKEMKEMDSNLRKEMQQMDSNLQKEIQYSKIEMMEKMERQTKFFFAGFGGFATFLVAATGLMIKFLS